jgi:hypothetical protein
MMASAGNGLIGSPDSVATGGGCGWTRRFDTAANNA